MQHVIVNVYLLNTRSVKAFEFGEIQKFSRLAEQAGESDNK